MRYFFFVLLAGALTTAVVGCSDEHAATMAPTTMPAAPTVNNAQVLVAGWPIQGLVVEGTDEPSVFRVHVNAPGGLSAVERVVLQYSQPG